MVYAQKFIGHLKREAEAVPTYYWGGFFLPLLALTRLLHDERPKLLPNVITTKYCTYFEIDSSLHIDGSNYIVTKYPSGIPDGIDPQQFSFDGPNSAELEVLYWRDGEIIDTIEQLSYQLSQDIDPEVFRSGAAKRADLPTFDKDSLERLASAALNGLDELCIGNSMR